MNISIAVVAHTTRHAMAYALAEHVSADYLTVDDGTLDAAGNHANAWQWHTNNTPTGWAVVLEDDAQPVPHFRAQLTAALNAAPAPIVSLYLGTNYPRHWQTRIRNTLDTHPTAHWLISDHLLHAVAVAIHAELLPITLDHRPTEDAITRWARQHQHPIAYCIPSIVDHADTSTTITHRHDPTPRNQPRRAWRTGTRHHWTNQTAPLH